MYLSICIHASWGKLHIFFGNITANKKVATGGEKYERALGIIKIKIQHAKLIKGKRKDKGREDVRLFEK